MTATLLKPKATPETIELLDDSYHGMIVFWLNGLEYTAGTVDQAERAARQIAGECLDLIDAELIIKHSCLPSQAVDLVRSVQEYMICMGEEPQILFPLIHDLDGLVEESMSRYGRAHFLGLFDHKTELGLSQFSDRVSTFIQQALGVSHDHNPQICIYQLG